MKKIARITSGCQTGVDRGALDAALVVGFPCGGWVPARRTAEDGVIPDRYPVRELATGGYRQRTVRNVVDSDGTLVLHFGEPEGGTAQTVKLCFRHAKPCLAIDASEVPPERAAAQAVAWAAIHGIETLNIAGPRATKEPRAYGYALATTMVLLRLARASPLA